MPAGRNPAPRQSPTAAIQRAGQGRCNLSSHQSIYDVKNEEYKFDELSTLKIKCDLINIIKGEENKDITGVWELEVNIK